MRKLKRRKRRAPELVRVLSYAWNVGCDWKWVRGHYVFMEFAQSNALRSARFQSQLECLWRPSRIYFHRSGC